MKKYFVTGVFLAVVCLSFNIVFAQSRRPPVEADSRKANQRPPQTQTDPTPPPAKITDPEDLPNTTNIRPIAAEKAEIQEENSVDGGEDVIKIDTKVVSVPVKILDRKGRFISGLNQENFQIFENNVPQEIAYFSNEQQPFTVALVLDMSYSTTFKIEEIHQAAMSFIAQLRKDDKVMVVSFDGEVHVLTAPTSDRDVLQRAIQGTSISATGTSLYEAIDFVINKKLNKIGGRKAIVLFTDGVDTTSRRANDLGNLSDALEADVLIYPVQYDTYDQVQAMKNKPLSLPPNQPGSIPSQTKSPFPFPLPTGGIGMPGGGIPGRGGTPNGGGTTDRNGIPGGGIPGSSAPSGIPGDGTSREDYRRADEYLQGLADRTGGRLYQASTAINLTQAFANIAAELREYYSLGYYPKEEGKEGSKRKIKVRVNQENTVVRARDGYVVGKKDKK